MRGAVPSGVSHRLPADRKLYAANQLGDTSHGGRRFKPAHHRAGDNDLTALAESLDAMRLAFRAQQEREASTYAANQALISQMSHDLRTP